MPATSPVFVENYSDDTSTIPTAPSTWDTRSIDNNAASSTPWSEHRRSRAPSPPWNHKKTSWDHARDDGENYTWDDRGGGGQGGCWSEHESDAVVPSPSPNMPGSFPVDLDSGRSGSGSDDKNDFWGPEGEKDEDTKDHDHNNRGWDCAPDDNNTKGNTTSRGGGEEDTKKQDQGDWRCAVNPHPVQVPSAKDGLSWGEGDAKPDQDNKSWGEEGDDLQAAGWAPVPDPVDNKNTTSWSHVPDKETLPPGKSNNNNSSQSRACCEHCKPPPERSSPPETPRRASSLVPSPEKIVSWGQEEEPESAAVDSSLKRKDKGKEKEANPRYHVGQAREQRHDTTNHDSNDEDMNEATHVPQTKPKRKHTRRKPKPEKFGLNRNQPPPLAISTRNTSSSSPPSPATRGALAYLKAFYDEMIFQLAWSSAFANLDEEAFGTTNKNSNAETSTGIGASSSSGAAEHKGKDKEKTGGDKDK
ncbi:hypothetical protein QBC35DRAFT_453011 [Podospora australis]|uniref:Uncharacterized protein n=1 Tax=Podospora australis TaxID=1536484 RepID=A0AAN6WR81_9PEZI|nr:hypothetical protein QBC35DRAFT_453011 [Podospora australis]